MKPMLFNPYNGLPRHPADIQSDPQGKLLVAHGEALRAAAPAQQAGANIEAFKEWFTKGPMEGAAHTFAWDERLNRFESHGVQMAWLACQHFSAQQAGAPLVTFSDEACDAIIAVVRHVMDSMSDSSDKAEWSRYIAATRRAIRTAYSQSAGAPLPLAPSVPLTVDEYQAKYASYYRQKITPVYSPIVSGGPKVDQATYARFVQALLPKPAHVVHTHSEAGDILLYTADQMFDFRSSALQELNDVRTASQQTLGGRAQFVESYCQRSKITREFYDKNFVALPCDCDDMGCAGWATIRREAQAILQHLDMHLVSEYVAATQAPSAAKKEGQP